LGAQVGGEIGVLPRGGPFAELTVGAAWPSWRVELSGLGSVGLEGYTTRRSQLGVDMNLVALAARGCWVPHKDRIEVPICAAAEAGRLQARGRGLQRPEVASALWLAATVGVRPRWAVAKRVAIGADVEMVVPFLHHRFVSTDAGELYALGPVAGRFTAGIEIRLF
jgi:hypothetical protein